MITWNKLSILGVCATFSTSTLIMSSCHSTRGHQREDRTVMESNHLSENLHSDCGCKKEGNRCDCEDNGCAESCGGENSNIQ